MGPLQRVEQLPPRWQKFSNSKCKIPTEPLISLKTSDRGCSSIRFSHNGYFLAYAEVSKSQNNVISIAEVNRSNLHSCPFSRAFFDLDSRGPQCCPIQWPSADDLRSGLVENGSISSISIRRFVCQVRTSDLASTSVEMRIVRLECGTSSEFNESHGERCHIPASSTVCSSIQSTRIFSSLLVTINKFECGHWRRSMDQ